MKPGIISTLLIFVLFSSFSGRSNAQFHLNGSAIQTMDSCFQLTPAQNWSAGSIWFTEKINLNESFQVLMDLNLGCKDANGADGMVFGFQPISTSIGSQGEGIGFQGVSPSLGIEFDTWQNPNLNDPAADHIAIIRNGIMSHGAAGTLAGPIQASPTSQNIEDCQFHEMRVNWDAEKLELEVWFDCELRLSYTGDIVNSIFNGDPEVFWGFTSATGGANNLHEVCFSYTTFLDGFEDVVICPGGQFQLEVSGGSSYSWSPGTGLSNPNIPNPIASPDETTTYIVEVQDDCNIPFFDTITVFIDGDTVFFELGEDTTLCEGNGLLLDATSFGMDTVEYQWSTFTSESTFFADNPGTYSVTVTVDQYCVSEDKVTLQYIPLPKVDLGPDLLLCYGQTHTLDATFFDPDVDYFWNDGSADPVQVVTEPGGLFSIALSNECGMAEDLILIEYDDCEDIFFPNVFSPNNDGINDVFIPFDGGDVETITVLQVYDRWGSLVYEAQNFKPNDFGMGWNGEIGGEDAPAGVYTWWAEVIFRNWTKELKKGDLTLIR